MPEVNTYDKPAGQIVKGNYLFGKKVVDVQPKRVNTVVRLEAPVAGQDWWTFKLTDMLEVGVEEMTPEEREAYNAELLEENRRHFVAEFRDFIDKTPAQLDAVEQRMAQRRADGWGLLDYYTLNLQLNAFARADLARQLDAQYLDAIDKGASEFEAAVRVVNRELDVLTRRALRMNATARSTAVLSNLCDDLALQAAAAFLSEMRYASFGIDEVNIPG